MYDGDLTIEEKYRSIAKDTHEKMENTIQMAYQCNDLGDQTLAMLVMDREKLRKVDEDLDFINSSLKRSEYHLHSIESWSGAIGNYFRGPPKREKSGTYANSGSQKEEAPACPKTVWRGSILTEKKVRNAVVDEGIHSFNDGEYIMYLCSNAGVFADTKKVVNNCVVVTNLGVFQVVDGKRTGGLTGGIMLRSVSSASLVKGSFMKNDVVSVSLWGGKTFSLEFWNRKSSEFITWMLNAIPAKCREWTNDRSGPRASSYKRSSAAAGRRSGAGGGAGRASVFEDGQPGASVADMAEEHEAIMDEHLDELNGILDQVNFKAKMIGEELKEQAKLTTHINERVAETDEGCGRQTGEADVCFDDLDII
eukprot:CAMPEP_0197526882 /NCGR_PEP_ID=MMETSP1318-20131121/19558_1 /TAXON_ID=552666 /ORGANISM="Partenskyella glossopodia, Strain RCC365" /LENGTH=364 /DNA_ID=CAMNT_0043081243 /DNA_START=88 /DNA_END=1183 /DNA_ORIENTATION=+